jgi:hypothetical protein
MKKSINITVADSVTPEVPRDEQSIPYVANQILAMHPTESGKVVGRLNRMVITVPVTTLSDIANTSVLAVKVPFPFILNAVNFRVGSKAVTTAAKLATLTAQVGGVSVTGGAIALTSANCTPSGAAVAGSAITAGNEGAEGATVGVVASAVTAFSEGNGFVEFDVTQKAA